MTDRTKRHLSPDKVTDAAEDAIPGTDPGPTPAPAAEGEATVTPHGVAPAPAPPVSAAQREIRRLRGELKEKEEQLSKAMDAYRSIRKETDRLRGRIEQHQKRRFEQSKGDFIGRFVEVLDNLDRAIEAVENHFDPDAVLQGIILVRSRLVQLLREEGLEKIFVDGQPFDPLHSEAAAIEEVDDAAKDNIVLKELQRGYMLKGSLLRPARVVVGRYRHDSGDATPSSGPPPASESEPSPPSEDDRDEEPLAGLVSDPDFE